MYRTLRTGFATRAVAVAVAVADNAHDNAHDNDNDNANAYVSERGDELAQRAQSSTAASITMPRKCVESFRSAWQCDG